MASFLDPITLDILDVWSFVITQNKIKPNNLSSLYGFHLLNKFYIFMYFYLGHTLSYLSMNNKQLNLF